MAVIPISRVAMSVCDEVGDSQYKMLSKYIRYINRGVRDLVIYVVPEWKDLVITSRVLSIGNNFYVDLPEDYIYYTKIGICGGGGIALLGVNEDMCGVDTSLANCPCSSESTEAITSVCCGTTACAGDYPFNNTWNGNAWLGEVYGQSGGRCYPGYFKIDKGNNRVILNTDLSSINGQLIIEYKADPTMNGVSVVPSECELALVEFALWRDNQNKRPNVAQMHQANYQVEYNRLKKLYSSLTAEEWRSVFLQSTTSSVKR